MIVIELEMVQMKHLLEYIKKHTHKLHATTVLLTWRQKKKCSEVERWCCKISVTDQLML